MSADDASNARAGAATGNPYAAAELLKVALGWLVVLIPAAWGVGQVVARSAALFGR